MVDVIHVPTWIAPNLARLFDRYLGRTWSHHDEVDFWKNILAIPDEDVTVRQELRSYLITFMRKRARHYGRKKKLALQESWQREPYGIWATHHWICAPFYEL